MMTELLELNIANFILDQASIVWGDGQGSVVWGKSWDYAIKITADHFALVRAYNNEN